MLDLFRQTNINIGDLKFIIGARNYFEDNLEGIGAQIMQKCGAIPRHIAFCMDGNRRFARKAGIEDGGGHIAGFATMVRLLIACHRMGIKAVTVYAFSIENFNRSPKESELLFNLVRTKLWDMVHNRDSAMRKLGWQVRFPGHRSMLKEDIIERMNMIEGITSQSNGMIVNICAPYTTRDDIATAVASIVSAGNISSEALENARHMAGQHPLDMLVRTSGETRLSDFMAWEIDSGCSIEFIPDLWPELTVWKLYQLVGKWQLRHNEAPYLVPLDSLCPSPPLVSVSKRKPTT